MRRFLLKLSGEALKGPAGAFDPAAAAPVADRVASAIRSGVQAAMVVGAGNVWRGEVGKACGMDPVRADYMGMLGTAMNALFLKELLAARGVPCDVQSAIPMAPFADTFDHARAIQALESGRAVVFAAGTGHPFFTTDTTAALRALEIKADALLKATKVDGVYTADPKKDPAAVRYDRLSFDEALAKGLKVMDAAAFSLCRDNGMPIIVFNFSAPDGLERLARGDFSVGTLVSNG